VEWVEWDAAGPSVGGREHTGCALTGPHWSQAASWLCVAGWVAVRVVDATIKSF